MALSTFSYNVHLCITTNAFRSILVQSHVSGLDIRTARRHKASIRRSGLLAEQSRAVWEVFRARRQPFIELVSFFYCVYFLLLLVIWLSVENICSTEPIAAFLDLGSRYIFWLHLWVNKNVDGCLKYVYNIIISIYRSIYSWIEFFEVSANIVSLGMRIDIVSNRDEPSDLYPYLS